MANMKPILFNTYMVRALLDNRKMVTRRVVKPQPPEGFTQVQDAGGEWFFNDKPGDNDMMAWWPSYEKGITPPYQPGDILYVRETWCSAYDGEKYFYFADKCTQREENLLLNYDDVRWRPSIHMPREAARLFLRVTGVWVERLQNISSEDIDREGIDLTDLQGLGCITRGEYIHAFQTLWDSTINPSDRALYGWDANPWVWVIGLERISKEEAMKDA